MHVVIHGITKLKLQNNPGPITAVALQASMTIWRSFTTQIMRSDRSRPASRQDQTYSHESLPDNMRLICRKPAAAHVPDAPGLLAHPPATAAAANEHIALKMGGVREGAFFLGGVAGIRRVRERKIPEIEGMAR